MLSKQLCSLGLVSLSVASPLVKRAPELTALDPVGSVVELATAQSLAASTLGLAPQPTSLSLPNPTIAPTLQSVSLSLLSSINVPTLPSTSLNLPTTIPALPSTSLNLPTTIPALPSTSLNLPTTKPVLPSTSLSLPNPLAPKSAPPVAVASTQDLGYATDPGFNPATYRDGGGGACLNDHCVIGFSDSFTTSGNQFLTDVSGVTAKGQTSFVHNSFVLFDPKGGNPPTSVYDYGNRQASGGVFTGPVLEPMGDEKSNPLFAIWPNSNQIPLQVAGLEAEALVGVANALNENQNTLYNTMYAVQVTENKPNGKVLSAVRLAQSLFTAEENLYGTFCVTRGHNDPFVYLFSSTTTGPFGPSYLKVARAPALTAPIKATYEYWDGKIWSPIQPSPKDGSGAILSTPYRLDTGELYWSTHHDGWVLVTQTFGEFRAARANTDDFTQGFGPWTSIYQARLPAANDNDPVKVVYGGHAYPDWDKSHGSLLLSWALDVNWVQMAIVTWA